MSTKPLPPFTCNYSSNLPELLQQLNITLAITTYQAGKVIFISATSPDNIIQLPRNFKKAMGIAFHAGKMAISVEDEVIVLANSPELAKSYPPKPDTYDALYLPRATYYTGHVDLHDLDWAGKDLWAVNTKFSCLSRIDENFSFTPVWKPFFISDLVPEDRCHLNGMAMEDGIPRYVTALGQTDLQEGWRPNKSKGGIILDVEKNEVIASGLAMPHSPRIYDGELYCLMSALGQLVKVDPANGNKTLVHQFDSYVRGMAKKDDYLFVGISKIRHKSPAFGDLPIAEKSTKCGIEVIHFPTMSRLPNCNTRRVWKNCMM